MREIKKKFRNHQSGQSLIEVIIAMAIFALMAATMVSLTVGSYAGLLRGGNQLQAESLANEAIEALKSVRETGWNTVTSSPGVVAMSGSHWSLTSGASELINNKFTRTIAFADVCRDASDNLTSCPGSYTDIHSKKATVNVSWAETGAVTNSVQRVAYITNWDSRDWTQTDWSGGSGQAIWSNAAKYDSDDGNSNTATAGEVKLKGIGNNCGVKSWSFNSASDYAYNAAKIEVTGGAAQLIGSSGGPIDGNTKGMWHLDEVSGDVLDYSGIGNHLTNVKGSPLYNQSGKFSTSLQFSGNSSRYINNGQQIGLGITGAITIDAWIYRTAAAVVPEAIISKWRETGHKRSYALVVDATNRLQLNLSGDAHTATIVTAVNTVPLNTWVHAAGVYDGSRMYIFQNGVLENSIAYSGGIADQAAFVSISGADEFAGGDAFFNGKIDEARVSSVARWTAGFTPPAYAYGPVAFPSDNPTINPNNTYAVTAIDTWSAFTETATKNGGEIYYQMSDNGGSSWKYWNGSNWTVAGADNYNTASAINTNIGSFTTSTGQIMFKAFLSSNGSQQVILDEVRVSCETQYNWNFFNAPDYSYNAAKISVSGGTASLVDQGGGGSCSGTATACTVFGTSPTCLAQAGCAWGGGASGATTNPSFDSDSAGWAYADWETANQVSGDRQSAGGNPNGYFRVVVAGKKNSTISGYWRQSFVTSATSPVGTLSFDWRIPNYSATGLTSYYLYAYVENTSGAPILANYVWKSPLITATTNWAAVSSIDISSKIPTAGTYYLKVVARGIYDSTNGPGTTIGAFDNVQLNWTKASSCSGTATACNTFSSQPACQAQGGCSWASSAVYPADNPSINPIAVYSGNVNAWSAFMETATKNGGEIYYQLSSDGSAWKYWNGGSWTSAGGSNYNTANVINTNIATFTTSTGQIMFKAFLSSSGSQQVILDNARVGWGENDSSSYSAAGNFISSAFNMSPPAGGSPVQILEWDEDVSGCGSCDIQLQLRVAPDDSGAPGVWTSWYGESGAGTYFTNPFGVLVSTDLNGKHWVQYRAELSGDGAGTPILQETRVNYK